MKKRILALFSALALSVTAISLVACKDPVTPPPGPGPDPDPGPDPQPPVTSVHYVKDADIVEDGATRYLLYTTNETSGENDNAIAVKKGTKENNEWKYGEEKIVLSGALGKWDENIGSASLVKGTFSLDNKDYGWLMAYCATKDVNDRLYSIGLAVAETPDGEWTRVSETPLIKFDAEVYGDTSAGCYAPSLVNLNKESAIRVFYTYADPYGHFAKFVDVDASDLAVLYSEAGRNNQNIFSGEVQCPNHGAIAGGDLVSMFPNADFAFDKTANVFYAVKDYSPTPATKPNYADRIQLLSIAEAELNTAEMLEGWQGLRLWDNTDTEDGAWDRLYSACIVSDAYGHVDGTKAQEIVYNVCALEDDDEDWEFTQKLQSFVYTPVSGEE